MITVAELKAKSERKFRDFLKFKIDEFFHDKSLAGGKDEVKREFSEKAACHSEAISKSLEFFPLEIRSDKGKTSDNLLAREKDFLPLIQNSKQKKVRATHSFLSRNVRGTTGLSPSFPGFFLRPKKIFCLLSKKNPKQKGLLMHSQFFSKTFAHLQIIRTYLADGLLQMFHILRNSTMKKISGKISAFA